ncbi:hypothetical protein Nepgr_008622 [Nepenthes gracilis]|uniref:Uncharacterized protein n=1 Tax=Nepenthes gracilis TaxID=150966 RepID=A0AAD3S9U6_NEPGR|nr:hypothetical protein Nepgr_008622 [Nepenthes gracilis]
MTNQTHIFARLVELDLICHPRYSPIRLLSDALPNLWLRYPVCLGRLFCQTCMRSIRCYTKEATEDDDVCGLHLTSELQLIPLVRISAFINQPNHICYTAKAANKG